jgi:transcriptional regulator with XRE-family HTH domain
MSDSWPDEVTARIAGEIRRLRGDRSGQWLSDRTEELGHRVSRSTISEIETGRRKSITVSDLILLAAALDTAPIALIYPGPHLGKSVRITPDCPELPEIVAVEWFTGELDSVSDVPGDSGKIIQIPMQEAMNYWENLRPLKLARRLRDLDTRRKDVLREIGLKRGKVPDEEIAALAAIAEGLKRRIDEERAPNRDFFEEMFGDGG